MNEDRFIRARVVNFAENAMHHHFQNGGFQFYDVTLLVILEPKELEGTKLPIYHNKHEQIDPVWRTTGAILEFTLSQKLLSTMDVLFTGSVKALRGSPPQVDEG